MVLEVSLHAPRCWNFHMHWLQNSKFVNLNCQYAGICLWKTMITPSSITHPILMPLLFSHDFSPFLKGENAPNVHFKFTSKHLDIRNDTDLLKCFLNLPLPDVLEKNPVDFKWIHNQQKSSIEIATKAAKYPFWYFNKFIDDQIIVCHALPSEVLLTLWKNALKKEMIIPLIKC